MSNFEIRKKNKTSSGLYSLVHFPVTQVILPLKGKICSRADTKKLSTAEIDNLLQINNNLYLNLSSELSFFVQHSCNPNTTVKILGKSAFLVAGRAISPQEEITFDYSVTSNDTTDDWFMACNCGQWNCRKIVSGFNTLNSKDKNKYIKLGIVPKYIKLDINDT